MTFDGTNFAAPHKIADVGQVEGLGAVASVPSSGFAHSAAAVQGHGYVVHTRKGDYAAFFTDSVDNNGTFTIKFLYPLLNGAPPPTIVTIWKDGSPGGWNGDAVTMGSGNNSIETVNVTDTVTGTAPSLQIDGFAQGSPAAAPIVVATATLATPQNVADAFYAGHLAFDLAFPNGVSCPTVSVLRQAVDTTQAGTSFTHFAVPLASLGIDLTQVTETLGLKLVQCVVPSPGASVPVALVNDVTWTSN